MTALLGAVGWGLLTIGAVTHLWHHGRLRQLLAVHLDRERLPALVLVAAESVLSLSIAVAFLADAAVLGWLALAAFVVAVGFMLWILRLIVTGSTLPCACSFSERPTGPWSLARASCVALVLLLGFGAVATDPAALTVPERVATLVSGLVVAGGIFVLPEAVSWPESSRALMARVDAYASGSENAP